MDEQNLNRKHHLNCLNNADLRSDHFCVEKSEPNECLRPTMNNGVVNRFGFKYVVNRKMNKENKQLFAEESSKKLKKQNPLSKKPTFKVGIPHHKYWSPTARDTPVSHFHGLNKGLKSRKIFTKTLRYASLGEINGPKQPVAYTHINCLKQEKTIQEDLKIENSVNNLAKKDSDSMKSRTSHDYLSDIENAKYLFNIVFVIIMIFFFLIKYFALNY